MNGDCYDKKSAKAGMTNVGIVEFWDLTWSVFVIRFLSTADKTIIQIVFNC